jgi:hypothetical protein
MKNDHGQFPFIFENVRAIIHFSLPHECPHLEEILGTVTDGVLRNQLFKSVKNEFTTLNSYVFSCYFDDIKVVTFREVGLTRTYTVRSYVTPDPST